MFSINFKSKFQKIRGRYIFGEFEISQKIKLKRSGDPGPEVGGTTPEGSLTLVYNLLLVVANIGLDILGKFTKLNITNILFIER